jgi:hypothetical protein
MPRASDCAAGRVARLKTAEPALEFWNNPGDAIYDEL